jgi:hypothetical protein
MKISIQLYQRIGVQTYFGLQIPASGHFMGAVDKPIWKRFIYDLYDLCFFHLIVIGNVTNKVFLLLFVDFG